jgi:hypothetical protein
VGSTPAPTIAPPDAADLTLVTAAARRVLAGSASVSVDLLAAQVFGATQPRVQGSGAFDLAAGLGYAEMRQASGLETVLFVPDQVYVRQPPSSASALPAGKVWISASVTQSETIATNFPQFVLEVEDLNPALLLGEMAWGATSAAPLGPLTVSGTAAQGYLVRVDLNRASAQTSGPAAAALSKALQYEQTAMGEGPGAQSPAVEVRVWIDGHGRVVQLQASPPGSGVGTTNFVLTKFGTQVTVTPPATTQVVDIASLTPAGERENNGRGDADGA